MNYPKKILILIISLFSMKIYAGEYKLENVPAEYMGIYVPSTYELLLNTYKSHEKAMNKIAPTHYDVLFLKKDICYSTLRFNDQYAVSKDDFEAWEFFRKGDDYYILDENNYLYRRIDKNTVDSKDYEIVEEYVLSVIFRDFLSNKKISLKNNSVNIYGTKYKVLLDPSYSDAEKALYLVNSKGVYFLIIDGLNAKIVKAERNEEFVMEYYPTDIVVQEFSLSN
ncbi:MAG: hypothetical protein K6A43_04390 [Treponema sp.]|nr:hypothetical protein [Treponema sp.]